MKAWQRSIAAGVLATITATSLPARTRYVPIVYRQTSGERPYVRVRLNDKNLLFMVHANTSFDAMTTHANAKAAGIGDLVAKGDYGITAVGRKSTLGLASARVATFTVGGSVIRDMPLRIFEIPQTPPVDGMVGLGWLRQAKAMVDYGHDRLAIPARETDAIAERRRLTREGYVAVAMTWDAAGNRYVVYPKVNGRSGQFTVSTVSYLVIDDRFARASGVALSDRAIDTYGGPTGATGSEWETTGGYTIELAGKRLTAPKARSYDIYAYDGTARPSDTGDLIAGYLGCDFMRANGAVIDFGSGTLFLKP